MKKTPEHEIVQQPAQPGRMITSSGGHPLTVGDLRNAIAYVDDAVEITFGGTLAGASLEFYRFKWRGEDLLQIELNEAD
jgi:hypothetical protein